MRSEEYRVQSMTPFNGSGLAWSRYVDRREDSKVFLGKVGFSMLDSA